MLRLRSSIPARLLSSSAASSVPFPLHRLLSAASPAVSPNPTFAVEDYLVGTCGLTPAQALKASTKLSHLKSPSKPDAVLAFLAGLGLSGADMAALVAKDPQLLCADVEKTLSPFVVGLTSHGLSTSEVARLASLAPGSFRRKSIVSNLPYYLSLLGSFENLLRALKFNTDLLSCNPKRIVKPNLAVLRECGLGDFHIAKLCIAKRWLLTTNPKRFRAIVDYAEGLGVPRGAPMFRHVLCAVSALSEEKIAARMDYLKKTFRWSDAEVRIAVCKAPNLLTRSKDTLQGVPDLLISEVGLEPAYMAHRSAILTHSLEGRLRPWYYVVKFLKENGLLKRDPSYTTVVKLSEKAFMEKFIFPHKEAAPHLGEDYATACTGESAD